MVVESSINPKKTIICNEDETLNIYDMPFVCCGPQNYWVFFY